MKKLLWITSLVIASAIALTACQEEVTGSVSADTTSQNAEKTESAPTTPDINYVACKDPRPAVCTKEYKPVCAQKETGIVCVTIPCSTTENVTASNACTACTDSKIISYIPDGACPE